MDQTDRHGSRVVCHDIEPVAGRDQLHHCSAIPGCCLRFYANLLTSIVGGVWGLKHCRHASGRLRIASLSQDSQVHSPQYRLGRTKPAVQSWAARSGYRLGFCPRTMVIETVYKVSAEFDYHQEWPENYQLSAPPSSCWHNQLTCFLSRSNSSRLKQVKSKGHYLQLYRWYLPRRRNTERAEFAEELKCLIMHDTPHRCFYSQYHNGRRDNWKQHF